MFKNDLRNGVNRMIIKDKKSDKEIKLSDIVNTKNGINTKVYCRKFKLDNLPLKLPNECNDDEILQYYGKPILLQVKTCEDLEKHYNKNCFVKNNMPFPLIKNLLTLTVSCKVLANGNIRLSNLLSPFIPFLP